MSDKADAVLEELEGRTLLRFERTLPHPPNRIWSALTELSELIAWHPTPFGLMPGPEGEIGVGSVVRHPGDGPGPGMPDGKITAYDPPHLLAYTWGEDHLHWELLPREQGCVLMLTHTFHDRFKAARDGAGWHQCLEALHALLAGAPDRKLMQQGWSERNSEYQQRFGISPEQATPPPGRG